MSTPPRTLMNLTGAMVALGLVVILALAMYALARWDIPAQNHDILLVVITAVTTNIGLVVGFFFGSSVQNKTKDDTMSAMADTAAKTLSAALPPQADKTVNLNPGQTAEVKAAETP